MGAALAAMRNGQVFLDGLRLKGDWKGSKLRNYSQNASSSEAAPRYGRDLGAMELSFRDLVGRGDKKETSSRDLFARGGNEPRKEMTSRDLVARGNKKDQESRSRSRDHRRRRRS